MRTQEEQTRYRALSETDVLSVIDIVRSEYNVDEDRVYLMGHSMGGLGTWWLGQKYADVWATSMIVPTTPAVFEFFSRHRKGSSSASANGSRRRCGELLPVSSRVPCALDVARNQLALVLFRTV